MPQKAISSVLFLIILSIACGNPTNPSPVNVVTAISTPTLTDVQASGTRTTLIEQNQESFLFEETWQKAPSSCRQSMTQIKSNYNSSGTVLTEEVWIKIGHPDIWVYHLLLSNHAMQGETPKEYTLIPGIGENRQEFKVAHLNYRGFKSSDNLIFIDIAILSVYSIARIERDEFHALGLDKIKSGENLTVSEDPYYTFGYIDNIAQFSMSKIWSDFNIPGTNYSRLDLIPLEGQTTTNIGASGGATCDNQGNLVGLTAAHHGPLPTEYFISPIPANGIDQVMAGIQQAEDRLESASYFKSSYSNQP